uniref:Uncharacterized protein n=1 Tax=Cucumis melo TaxID=3656 RepID=A0A9I9EEP8_CUCME
MDQVLFYGFMNCESKDLKKYMVSSCSPINPSPPSIIIVPSSSAIRNLFPESSFPSHLSSFFHQSLNFCNGFLHKLLFCVLLLIKFLDKMFALSDSYWVFFYLIF